MVAIPREEEGGGQWDGRRGKPAETALGRNFPLPFLVSSLSLCLLPPFSYCLAAAKEKERAESYYNRLCRFGTFCESPPPWPFGSHVAG